jgi:glycosyltransferase involved in cell wall biosynthesis
MVLINKNYKPLISIIINCYNGEKYLKYAIDSVYKQTYKNWEIILWDNNSYDNTRKISKKYDNKLKYFKSKVNTILGIARVNAVNEASGELVAFLDCDDVWLPKKLEQQLLCFEQNPEVGIVYSKANIIDINGKIIGSMPNKLVLPTGIVFGELVKENFIPFVSALIDKKKYYECGGFALHLINAIDYDLFLKISYYYPVIALNEITCMYRQHNNNLSSRTGIIGAKEGLEIVKTFLPSIEAKEGIKYQNVNLCCSYIKQLIFFKPILLIVLNPNIAWILMKRLFKKLINILTNQNINKL